MWIFTRRGFYSVVEDRDDPNMALVRARFRGDLEYLVEQAELGSEIITLQTADYPYRVHAPKTDVAAWLEAEVRAIDYDNFKNAAARDSAAIEENGPRTRLDALHRVWSVMAAAGD